MPTCLVKIAGMPTSKRRRAVSGKQTSGGKARVISVKGTEALPRKGNMSAGRRKPVVQPAIDAPMVTEVASAKKRSRPPQPTAATRTKATRAAGRASAKRDKGAAPKAEAPVTVETEEELVVEASAILEEMPIVEAPFASREVEQLPVSRATRVPPPVPTAADSAALAAPALDQGKRALVTAASRLLSTFLRWTGVR